MGALKNVVIGGARPTVEGDEVRCGDCGEAVEPDATRCPHCSSDIFTLKGRVLSRIPGMAGVAILLLSTQVVGILRWMAIALAVVLFGVAVYYFVKAPIYSALPPHRPASPDQ